MVKSRTVITADKSLLAANMYQLLFGPLGVKVLTTQSVEGMREAIVAMRGADLLVVNANVMAGRFERLAAFIEGNRRMAKAAKVFLLGEREREKGWDERLMTMPRTELFKKPFHPDEFTTEVKRILAIE